MDTILIIDDDLAVHKTLSVLIARMECESVSATSLADGLRHLGQAPYDVVLLDVNLPDGCGLDILPKIHQMPSEPDVIIMTGYGNMDSAEMAIRNGAWDYIQKTGSPQDVTLSLRRVLEYRKEKAKHHCSPVALNVKGIVGDSGTLHSCFDHLARAAAGDANVLISGETGTGKELFARAIHDNSHRSEKSLVVVDCTAIPESLVESLLFGHEKGVYTGADKARDGLVAQADGGTLFLDEVGEMPLGIQKVFLRVLQERKYRPVGGRGERPSNFRLVAATNRDLDEMVEAGAFRKDLLYRIRTIHISLPPLVDREDDAKRIAQHYIPQICERYGMEEKGISSDFIDLIERYDWPGNVRELINAMETAISNAGPESLLYSRHLPPNIRLAVIQRKLHGNGDAFDPVETEAADADPDVLTNFKAYRKVAIEKIEARYLHALLHHTEKRLDKSLYISGLSRSRFYDLLKQHNLSL